MESIVPEAVETKPASGWFGKRGSNRSGPAESSVDSIAHVYGDHSEEVSTLSTLTSPESETSRWSTSLRSSDTDQQQQQQRPRWSTRVIQPLAGSHRESIDRANLLLTITRLRFRSNALYGRESEIRVLKRAFAETKNPNTAAAANSFVARRFVLLEGQAGVGKSALAQHLKEQVVREAGFFLGGKFDQYDHQHEPYAAFTMICRELCDSLLAHKEDPNWAGCKWQFTFEQFTNKLREELVGGGQEVVQVLTTVFPDLVQLFGGEYLTSNSDMGYLESKNRFNYAFRRLLRLVATFGRVVLVLDDLQWCDVASLDLLKTLMTDCTSAEPGEHGLLVVATVRSDEVDERHPLTATLRELNAVIPKDMPASSTLSFLKVHRLTIGNLGLDQINEMLMDLLSVDSLDETKSLAQCVHRKTQGNIFYVEQFLKSLNSSDSGPPLLSFQMGTLKWTWDVNEIQVRESSTKNVVQIIQQKIETLPVGIQKLLPIIASLGASFDIVLFERVLEKFNKVLVESNDDEKFTPLSPKDFIIRCVQEGLLVDQQQQKMLKWEHDKIQEAALTSAAPEKVALLRYKLGEFLMEDCDQGELETNIFILVGLLDGDTSKVPKNNPKRTMLAELYLTAGTKAIRGAAFLSAATYLSRGIEVLPQGHWGSHYELSLNLFSSAAEAHYCCGKLEECRQWCDVICAQDRPIIDKRRAYTVMLDSINSEGNTALAEEKCVDVLAQLGCTFPKYGRGLHTLGGILMAGSSVKKLLKEIPSLPVMTDPVKIWAMRLLDRCATYTYQNKSDLFPLIVFKMLAYTRKYGYTDFSPPALCIIGLLLAAALGNLEGANNFGDLAVGFFEYDSKKNNNNKRMIAPVAKSRTLFVAASMCLHWQRPTAHLRKMVLDGYKVGLGSGDVESAMWCMYTYLDFGFHNGLPLAVLEKDCRIYSQQMKELGQDKIDLYLLCMWQVINNLLGREDDMSNLDGSILCLQEALPKMETQMAARAQLDRQRLLAAFWGGDFIKTAKLIEETGAHRGYFDETFAGCYVLLSLHFSCGLACFAAYKQTKKNKYRQMAVGHSKKIHEWAKKGNPNCVHYATLLTAERLSLKKGRFPEVVKLYKEAINLAGRQGFVHDQALANERLGEFYVSLKLLSDAVYYFQAAIKLYGEWGSVERGNVVVRRHGDLLVSEDSCLCFSANGDAPSAIFTGTAMHFNSERGLGL